MATKKKTAAPTTEPKTHAELYGKDHPYVAKMLDGDQEVAHKYVTKQGSDLCTKCGFDGSVHGE